MDDAANDLSFCAAKAAQMLNEIDDALGDDQYLTYLVVLFMLGAIANEKMIPTYQLAAQIRVVRSMLTEVERA